MVFEKIYRYMTATQADIDAIFGTLQRHVIVMRRLRAAGVTGIPTRIGRGGDCWAYKTALDNLSQLREEKRGQKQRSVRRQRRAKAFFASIRQRLGDQAKSIPDADREAISDLAFVSPASGPKSVHELEEAVARLYYEAPAFRELWSLMLRTQRVRLAAGLPFRMPPTLIVSPPGTGKSTAARRAGEVLGLTVGALDATSSGTFALTGVERGWGSSGPGIVVLSCLSGRTRNPLIVIDELEKAGGDITSTNGRALPGMHATLLSLLEPSTSSAWRCPSYQIPMDLSDVSYVMTANSLDGIPGPLLSRLNVIQIGHLSADHLAHAARQQARLAGIPEDVSDGLEAAARSIRRRRTMSLREVARLVDRLKGDENEAFFLH